MRRAGLFLFVVSMAAGCSVERLGIDRDCELDSDCQELLVCADGHCRAECVEARDCPVGRLCVPSGSAGVNSCAAPESPALCAFNSECPPGSLCLEGYCHAECVEDRDCPMGSTCEEGTCDAPVTFSVDAGFRPPLRDGSAPPCSGGRARCENGCADLARSNSNCGACGVMCPDGARCLNGACACEAPHETCGEECIDTRTSTAHCGGCNMACTGPCSESTCCGFGRASCGGSCIDVLDDDDNCGGCGVRCAEGRACQKGECAPENHLGCERALEVALRPGSRTEVRGTTLGHIYWFISGCGAPNVTGVFYFFELTERSLVYVRGRGEGLTFGILPPDCMGGKGVTCGVRECTPAATTDENDAVFELDAGTHHMIVTAGTRDTGVAFSLWFEVVPIGDAVVSSLPTGSFSVRETVVPGSGRASTCAPGGERAFSWVSCEMDPGGTLNASVTGGASLGIARGTRPGLVCGDAALTATIPAGPGLHVLSVDAPDTTTPLTFDLTGTRR